MAASVELGTPRDVCTAQVRTQLLPPPCTHPVFELRDEFAAQRSQLQLGGLNSIFFTQTVSLRPTLAVSVLACTEHTPVGTGLSRAKRVRLNCKIGFSIAFSVAVILACNCLQAFLRSVDDICKESGNLEASEGLTKLVDSVKKQRSSIDAAIGVLIVQQVSKCMTSMHSAIVPKRKHNEADSDDDDMMELMESDDEASGRMARGVCEWIQGRLPSHDIPPDIALLRAAVLQPGKRAVDTAAALKQIDCVPV